MDAAELSAHSVLNGKLLLHRVFQDKGDVFSLLWVFFCAHKIRETVTDVLRVEGRDLSEEKIGLTWRNVIRCG